MMNKKNLLISWKSERAGDEVLVNAIESLRVKKVRISKVLYLTNLEIYKTNSLEVKNILIESVKLDLAANDITSHQKIYIALKKVLEVYLVQNKNYNWHINISPGTPAMHSVWLILFAGGFFHDDTKLWSSQLEKKTNKTRIDEVIFPVETYLSEIRKYKKVNPTRAIYNLEEIKSAKLKDSLHRILRYAKIKGANLLITGERGTGKTRLAESILARVKGKQIITVLCGSLTPELAVSQIFGYRKGAFTGADNDKDGFIQKANGKILFLDEIQDLPKPVQRMLVQVLQDPQRRFTKLGDTEELSSNFELVCASHLPIKNLREKLDQDLFDRISLLVCEIPPVRDTREDLQMYWNSIWRELRQDMNISEKPIWNKRIEKYFSSHPLNGNFRDLQRLAYIIMSEELANPNRELDDKIEKAILESLSNDQLLNMENEKLEKKTLLEETHGNWKERSVQLQYLLATEAVEKYNTISLAAKKLNCDKGTLSKILSKVKN